MKTETKASEKWARERDALIAEKLMGWTRHPDKMDPTDNRTINGALYCAPGFEGYNGGSSGQFNVVPSFSTSIPAAFEVVEKMREDFAFECLTLGREWKVRFDNETGYWSAADESLPAAICLAALRAKGIGV